MSETMRRMGTAERRSSPFKNPELPERNQPAQTKDLVAETMLHAHHSISFLLRNSAGLHFPASPEAQWCHVIEFYVGRSYTHYLQAWPIRSTHSPPCSLFLCLQARHRGCSGGPWCLKRWKNPGFLNTCMEQSITTHYLHWAMAWMRINLYYVKTRRLGGCVTPLAHSTQTFTLCNLST